jgi:hypothetical protein
MKLAVVKVSLQFTWLLLLTSCGQAPSANCYSVCDDRSAVACSDIEQETCYNLCDALMQTSTECAEATEALSLCQLEQTWACYETGPSIQAPIACQTEENIQITFCVEPPTGNASTED